MSAARATSDSTAVEQSAATNAVARAAVAEDRAAVLALSAALHAENGQHPLDMPKVEALIDRCLARDRGCIGVIGPVGAIVLLLDGIWYSDESQLLEVFAYVDPAHRSSRHAQALVEYAKTLADALGVDVTVGIFSEVRQTAKIRLYRRWIDQAGASSAIDRTVPISGRLGIDQPVVFIWLERR